MNPVHLQRHKNSATRKYRNPMKKLWIVNACIIMAGSLGIINFFAGHTVVHGVITLLFAVAMFGIACWPKFMWSSYMEHMDNISVTSSEEPIKAQADGVIYFAFASMFLLGCAGVAILSIWFNGNPVDTLKVLFAPILIGVVLGLCFRKADRLDAKQQPSQG